MENATDETERLELRKISQRQLFAATLLPIRTVGVQVRKTDDANVIWNYVVCVSRCFRSSFVY